MTITVAELDSFLEQSFADRALSRSERSALETALWELHDEPDKLARVRNRAFEIVQQHRILSSGSIDAEALDWLEGVLRSLASVRDKNARQPKIQSWFSPGTDCRARILHHCQNCERTIDVCVFTISDNQIAQALLSAHRAGRKVRILSDGAKSDDLGSDVLALAREGMSVRLDSSTAHMHHKFAIFDEQVLLTGSFNWTFSATRVNQENVLEIEHPPTASRYLKEFEKLWREFGPTGA